MVSGEFILNNSPKKYEKTSQINQRQKNDLGENDCGDTSDELNCTASSSTATSCDPETHFKCGQKCIENSKLCDKNIDCPDESDEPLHCNVNECETDNGRCQQKCIDTPVSYRCACEPGYKLRPDKRSCDDINECGKLRGSWFGRFWVIFAIICCGLMLAITHLHEVMFANFRVCKYWHKETFANIRAFKRLPILAYANVCQYSHTQVLPFFAHANVCQYLRMLPIIRTRKCLPIFAHASVAIFRTRKCLAIFAHVANYSHTQMFANIRTRKCLPIFAHANVWNF
jgi:hypothetical protein